jgi:hypothetical protein
MKTYKDFISTNDINEDSFSFSYNDGGHDVTVLISGSSKDIKKVKRNLPSNTKFVNNVPDDATKICASDWLKLQ